MFTGIVEGTKRVVGIGPEAASKRLSVDLEDLAQGVRQGDSVAIDGCCLTVTGLRGSVASFDVVSETLRMTNLGGLATGARVNVERSLKVGDALGGHFVTGHVEGTAPIFSLEPGAGQTLLTVDLAGDLARLVIPKGSIALDGVSLTVAAILGTKVSVALIPYTLDHTTLGAKKKGDRVHVECDLIGKWVKQLLPPAAP